MLKIISLVLFSILASGCVNTLKTAKSQLLEKTPEQTVIDSLEQGKVGLSSGNGEKFDIAQDILSSRKYNQAIVDAPEYSAYLNELLNKLIQPIPDFSPKPVIFIVSDEGYNAVTRRNGGIFIPIDTVSNLRSEDEAAALIAHEVSHLILDHFSSEKNRDLSNKMLDSMMQVVMLMDTVKGESNYSSTLKVVAADYLINNSLFPAWNRETETKADQLGLDMLLHAGYSAEGMFEFVKRVGIHDEHKALEVSDYIHNTVNKDETGLNGEFSMNLGGLFTSTLAKIDDTLSSDYDDSEIRYKNLLEYYSSNYSPSFPVLNRDKLSRLLNTASASRQKLIAFKAAKISSKSLSGSEGSALNLSKAQKLGLIGISGGNEYDSYARLVMSKVRTYQHKSNTALKNLDIAIESDTATQSVYYRKYVIQKEQKEYKQALQTLDAIEEVFQESEVLLPEKIDLALLEDDELKANKLYLECMASSFVGKSFLQELCQTAKEGNFLSRQPL